MLLLDLRSFPPLWSKINLNLICIMMHDGWHCKNVFVAAENVVWLAAALQNCEIIKYGTPGLLSLSESSPFSFASLLLAHVQFPSRSLVNHAFDTRPPLQDFGSSSLYIYPRFLHIFLTAGFICGGLVGVLSRNSKGRLPLSRFRWQFLILSTATPEWFYHKEECLYISNIHEIVCRIQY